MSARTASLIAHDLHVRYGDLTILHSVDFRASAGQRVGVIGDNGSGKSTLLRVLSGVQEPDGGAVSRPDDTVHVGQTSTFPSAWTVRDVIDHALRPMHEAVRAVEQLSEALAEGDDAGKYAEAVSWADDHDAWHAELRAQQSLERFGLADLDAGRPARELSGGQRRRLALAVALTRRPSCLLLDEPTNDLDDAANDLLEGECVGGPGIVVVASHDRTFLDRICTHLVDLDARPQGEHLRSGTRFTGNYTQYLSAQAAARRRWERLHQEQQDELARLRAKTQVTHRDIAPGRPPRDNDKFGTKFKGARVDRAVARRSRDAERHLQEAERTAVRRPPDILRLRAALTGGSGRVYVRQLCVPRRLSLCSLTVPAGGKVLVTGASGSGKSTLLGVLAGKVQAATGQVVVEGRVGLLSQETTWAQPEMTVLETYARLVGRDQSELVPLNSLGLMSSNLGRRAVGSLSTGQQRRLALAALVARPPDLLLLDEPTNHLSLALVDDLTQAVMETTGTVIIASHDRWLRSAWEGDQLALETCGEGAAS